MKIPLLCETCKNEPDCDLGFIFNFTQLNKCGNYEKNLMEEKIMNCKQLEELIHDLCVAEITYLKAKHERVEEENNLNLTIDWNMINEFRLNDELPKISNQKQRDAFVSDKISSFKEKENRKLVEFNRLQRIYENREFLEYEPMIKKGE